METNTNILPSEITYIKMHTLPSEITYKKMCNMDGNGTPYNNGNTENGNSYGADGNQGNGKGNLNPHCTPITDGLLILLFCAFIYNVLRNKIIKL